MATHPKNNEYVRKWRKLNREKYLEYDRKNLLKYYYYKKGVKELMTIDLPYFMKTLGKFS